jgi:hypothetical protein
LVSLTDTLSRRSSVAVSADINGYYMFDSPESSVNSYMGSVRFRHLLTKALAFHAGYSRTVSTSNFANAQPFRINGIDVGLDYGDSLNIARRTTLSFATSTALYESTGSSTQFRLNGNIGITHSMGRTWSAFAGYVRDASYVPGYQDLVLTDSATASLGGLIAPRVRWTSGVYWTRGEIGLDSASHYTNAWVSSSLSLALTRSIAMYSQYSFNQYQTPPNSTTLTALTKFSRHSVSAGVNAWLPIFNGRRPTRDAGAEDHS